MSSSLSLPVTAPNATATTEDFEFSALSEARNYRNVLLKELGPAIRGDVLEIGAGIGQMTALFRELPQVARLLSVEPDSAFAHRFRETLPDVELIEGTIEQVPEGKEWDSVVSINVLEHIHRDEEELARYATALRARHGALSLFVPAGPSIYAPIDKDFGHFRRYTRQELERKLMAAGFTVERICYFNWVGYLAWWFNFCLLKKRSFTVAKVVAYDRLIFPLVHAMESGIARPPFGQSLLAVARA